MTEQDLDVSKFDVGNLIRLYCDYEKLPELRKQYFPIQLMRGEEDQIKLPVDIVREALIMLSTYRVILILKGIGVGTTSKDLESHIIKLKDLIDNAYRITDLNMDREAQTIKLKETMICDIGINLDEYQTYIRKLITLINKKSEEYVFDDRLDEK